MEPRKALYQVQSRREFPICGMAIPLGNFEDPFYASSDSTTNMLINLIELTNILLFRLNECICYNLDITSVITIYAQSEMEM